MCKAWFVFPQRKQHFSNILFNLLFFAGFLYIIRILAPYGEVWWLLITQITKKTKRTTFENQLINCNRRERKCEKKQPIYMSAATRNMNFRLELEPSIDFRKKVWFLLQFEVAVALNTSKTLPNITFKESLQIHTCLL